MKEECPKFDYFDYEPILEWGKAKVVFSDTFVNSKGISRKCEKLAHWTLVWDQGFIGFDYFRKREEESKARMAGAMFIYLWCNGVAADIAERCAQLYAANVIYFGGDV